jgi:hypothetical protein
MNTKLQGLRAHVVFPTFVQTHQAVSIRKKGLFPKRDHSLYKDIFYFFLGRLEYILSLNPVVISFYLELRRIHVWMFYICIHVVFSRVGCFDVNKTLSCRGGLQEIFFKISVTLLRDEIENNHKSFLENI